LNGRDFSHCALVIKINDSLKIAEAIGDTVQINSLQKFLNRSNDRDTLKNIVVGRLKQEYAHLAAKASAFAIKQAGSPYDDEYLPDNGKWYCSELIDEAFRQANGGTAIFEKEPMTFKNPSTGDFDTAWVSYYRQLNKPIPEGIPGINPGLMSRSPYLEMINIIRIDLE
jgi:uncharacterized protein YycO